MGRNPVLLLLLAAFGVTGSLSLNATPNKNLSYIVVTSDVLIPGSLLNVDLHLLDLVQSEGKESEECVLDLKVSSENFLWYRSNWKIDVEKDPKCFFNSLKLLVPEEALLKDKHVLKVESNKCFKFSRSVELRTESRELHVSVTTDKLKYKPGDLVLIKAHVHTQELIPYLRPANLSIYDSNQVPLVRWLNVTSEGILFRWFKLPKLLKEGHLTFVFESHEQQVNHTVKVEQATGSYDEELFLVDVRVPRYLTLPPSDESKGQSLVVNVVSSLVSGVPLHGSVELHFECDGKSGSLPPVELESGHKVISLKPDEVKEVLGLPKSDSLVGREVHVEVKVEEHRFLFEGRREEMLEHERKESKEQKNEHDKEKKQDGRSESDDLKGDESRSKVYVSRKFAVSLVDQSHVLFFTEFTPLFFKPGLSYVGQVLLKEVEETVEESSEEKEVIVNVKHYSAESGSPREEKLTLKLKSNSVREFSFKVPKEDTKLELEALFEDKKSQKVVKAELKELLPFSTGDGHFVQVLLKNTPPKVLVGEELKFTLETTFPYRGLTYILFSESLLVTSGMLLAPTETTKEDFSVVIPHNVSHLLSSTRLLVGVISPSGEVHTDSVLFAVKEPEQRPLKIEVPEFAESGMALEVTISAEPLTKVFIVALPELLVSDPKELEVRKKVAHEKLMRYLRYVSTPEFPRFVDVLCETCTSVPSLAPDSRRVMNESGGMVLTDGVLSFDPKKPWPLPPHKNGTLDDLELSSLEFVSEFEAGLWNTDVVVGHSGEEEVLIGLTEESRLYTIAAIGIRPGKGLVFTEKPTHFVVARKVVEASLKHPKSVVRGEELVLEVHLFNPKDKNVEVEVSLAVKQKSGLKLACLEGDKEKEENKLVHKVSLSPKKLEVVPLYVKSSPSGQASLEFEVEVVSDDVHQQLTTSVEIEYQGYGVLLTENLLLNNFEDDQVVILDVSKNITEPIEKSERALVKIFGHPLGPVIEYACKTVNSTHLLEERSKLEFILAVNALEHISNNSLFDKSSKDETNECVESVRDSVEYLLNKRRPDGSFSFHPSAPGYVWLNTIMMNVLTQLRNVLPCEKLQIEKTLEWLIQQQEDDGSFVEPNDVVLVRDEADVSNKVPLTSQVAISLLEAKYYLELPIELEKLVSKSIIRAIEYLEKALLKGDLDGNSYSLSVATYALMLADSNKFLEVLMKRDKLVVSEGNEKYFKVEEHENVGENALSLEATSYAILTSLVMEDLQDAKPYVNHVSKHMRQNGAFVTAQDTNVALRALSKYHRLHDLSQDHRQVNLEVNITMTNKNKIFVRFSSPFDVGSLYVDKSNLTLAGPLKIESSGKGMVLVQSLPEFNEAIPSFGPAKFDLKVETKQESSEKLTLKICAVNLEKNPSRFLVGEFSLLTGYELNVEKVEQKHDLHVLKQDDEVYVVFNKVQPDSPSCVELGLEKVFKVGKLETKYVKLYSAEEPFKPMLRPYKEEHSEVGIKEICPQCKC